ncbi:hypothetical protein [Stratiformator vulcanicus]|uniref:Uncharacterized protein n=1 Tax=Stratiformator vulcanicus TaxID=2527980 RepID=A0A517R5B1_9PLAN|nr:hypothetical protein [Stratiformator vulcanicus]QDT39030.1 hypothetical protein Pan189_34310 [Stratiformator vulcanicus]
MSTRYRLFPLISICFPLGAAPSMDKLNSMLDEDLAERREAIRELENTKAKGVENNGNLTARDGDTYSVWEKESVERSLDTQRKYVALVSHIRASNDAELKLALLRCFYTDY